MPGIVCRLVVEEAGHDQAVCLVCRFLLIPPMQVWQVVILLPEEQQTLIRQEFARLALQQLD